MFRTTTGSSNNQETRYTDAGPLRGGIIYVEAAESAPFAFWVTVSVLKPACTYKQVLKWSECDALQRPERSCCD